MRIAVLGATGHVAKCAVRAFSDSGDHEFYLFSRSLSKLENVRGLFPDIRAECFAGYSDFEKANYDVVFNGVGVWDTPGAASSQIFSVTEEYDRMVMEYQKQHPDTVSIHISSGAAYCGNYDAPVDESSVASIQINHLMTGDFYSVAKINSEAKHRAFPELSIVDIRLFGFFSRYINLDYPYFLSKMIRCVQKNEVFHAVSGEFWRDYIHPEDFKKLLLGIAEKKGLNCAVDVRSKAPISKSELIELFTEKYGLQTDTTSDVTISKTGLKPCYYSLAENEIYMPTHTALEAVMQETEFLLGEE